MPYLIFERRSELGPRRYYNQALLIHRELGRTLYDFILKHTKKLEEISERPFRVT